MHVQIDSTVDSTVIDARDKQLHDEGTYNRQDAVFRGRLNVKSSGESLLLFSTVHCLYDLYDAVYTAV